jgi:hypothetical protein
MKRHPLILTALLLTPVAALHAVDARQKPLPLPSEVFRLKGRTAFQGKPVQVFTLRKNGRGLAPEFRLKRDRVWLKIAPKTPVELILNNLDQRCRCKTGCSREVSLLAH